MASSIMEFLRWFFGLRQVDAGELIAGLSDADLGDTQISDVQEALALLREEVGPERQSLIAASQGELQATVAKMTAGIDHSDPTVASTATLRAADVARYIESLQPDTSAAVSTGDPATEPEPDSPLPDGLAIDQSPDDGQAQAGDQALSGEPSTIPDRSRENGGSSVGHESQAPHRPPDGDGQQTVDDVVDPIVDTYPGEWAGMTVQTNAAGHFVELYGAQVFLEPLGAGFVGVHEGYVLREDVGHGGVSWHNPANNDTFAVYALRDTGIILEHPNGTPISLSLDSVSWTVGPDDFAIELDGAEFEDFSGTGIVLRHPDGYDIRWTLGGERTYQDLSSGSIYDSLDEFRDVEYPEVWGDETVQVDDDGDGYIRVDEERLDLDSDGDGGFTSRYLSYELGESADGDLVWTNTPTQTAYEIRQLHNDGLSINNPQGGYVQIHEDNFFTYSNNDGTNSVAFEQPESFYEFVPDGFRSFNPDGNYYRHHTSNGDTFQDADTEQTYDTLDALQLAQGGDQNDPADEGNGAQADVSSDVDDDDGDPNRIADGAGENGERVAPVVPRPAPLTPPLDSIGVDYMNSATVLRIMHSGETHFVPLTTRQGGLFVTIGGDDYEVHIVSGEYIIVADGRAYDLDDDPTAPGWPFDRPAPDIDVTAFVEVPPTAAEGAVDDELADPGRSRYLTGESDELFPKSSIAAPTEDLPVEEPLRFESEPASIGDDPDEPPPTDEVFDS